MSTRTLRVGLLMLLQASFLASLFASAALLPERVATHFNGAGQPDGWMTRTTHLMFMGIFGLIFPLFLIGICWGTRFLPVGLVNIPHREYWLASERKAESTAYLAWHAVWFGCLAECFVIGLHWLVVFSNQRQPVQLPLQWMLGILSPFLLGVAVWVYSLYRRFGRVDSGQNSNLSGHSEPTPA